MSALFAKNGFSRPSLGYCGVFRLVLFPLESPPSIPFNWPAHCILLRRGINWPSKWNMRDSLKKKTAFSACDVSLPKPSLSCGRRGLGETPECVKGEGLLIPPFAGNVFKPRGTSSLHRLFQKSNIDRWTFVHTKKAAFDVLLSKLPKFGLPNNKVKLQSVGGLLTFNGD